MRVTANTRRARAVLVFFALWLVVYGLGPAIAGPAVPPFPAHTQVLVVGGTPAGIAAAVAAARAGVRTVLVESRAELGGDLTGGWLNTFDMNWGPRGQHLTRGIFLEVYRSLGQTFDVRRAKTVFERLTQKEPMLTVMLQTRVLSSVVREDVLSGVVLRNERTRISWPLLADMVIDATSDADIAAASGVPYTLGREDTRIDQRMQAATLIFRLGRVNYRRVVHFLNTHEKPHRTGGVVGRTAWGYSQIMRQYRPRDPRIGLYDLNLGWQRDRTVLVNAMQIFDVEGTNVGSVQEARAIGLAELPAVVHFLRTEAPGFERAVLVDAAPYLYIRETRHIFGLYRMRLGDILQSRDFWDRVAVASYPMDLHPYAPGQFSAFRSRRRVYAIPFRALVPAGVDHLLVVGRAISSDCIPAGSLRVVPTGMALGQAAGEAAALAVKSGMSPQRMATDRAAIAQLQRRLISSGAFLPTPQSLLPDGPALRGLRLRAPGNP